MPEVTSPNLEPTFPGRFSGADGLLAEIACAPKQAVHRLIQGVRGTGKTALLAQIRDDLRAGGTPVVVRVDGQPVTPGSAVLVDDAHTLNDSELQSLLALSRRDDITLIVAAEPRPRNAALRTLADSLQTRGAPLVLGRLTVTEIASRANAGVGFQLTTRQIGSIRRVSGGTPARVDASLIALEHLGQEGVRDWPQFERTIVDATTAWVTQQLRATDTDLLSTLVVAHFGERLLEVELAAILSVSGARAVELVDTARSSGLLLDDDSILPVARSPLLNLVGEHQIRLLQRELLTTQLELDALGLSVARSMAEAGLTDPRLATHLVDAADRFAAAEPAAALELYATAIRAGAATTCLAVRRAECAGRTGDFDEALRLVDEIWEQPDRHDGMTLAAAVRIAASVSAFRGQLSRSAELYRWLGTERARADGSIAAVVLLIAGDPEAAHRMLDARTDGPPTTASASSAMLAQGLSQSLTGPTSLALNSMTRALSMLNSAQSAKLVPDSAAAVTAVACLHCGELARAEVILRRAVAGGIPGDLTHRRHNLLLAWTTMLQGDLSGAIARLDDCADTSGAPARQARDDLFAHALRVGLARRMGDTGALVQAWSQAQDVIAEHSVDLLSLLPLGELWVAAARLREPFRIAHLVDQANDLLSQLRDPSLWASALHWYGVQAAILAESPAELTPHANALGNASRNNPYAAALAVAGRAWIRVLTGNVDVQEIEAAAHTLGGIGLSWDGARLAGEAALRATDTKAATALLHVARQLKQATSRVVDPAPTTTGAEPPAATAPAPAKATAARFTLTEREAEVADLLVLGMTYRDIGTRLFIAAKTVEHHVARIRRRLDADTRSEMLSMLRAMGYPRANAG